MRFFGSALFAVLTFVFGILIIVGFGIHTTWLAWGALALTIVCLALTQSSLDNYMLYNEDGITVRKCELGFVPRFIRFKYSEVRQIRPDQNAEAHRYRLLQINLNDTRFFLVPEVSKRNRPGSTFPDGSKFDNFIIESNEVVRSASADKA